MKSKEQILFELAQKIGEGIFNAVHILDHSEEDTIDLFRIYHGDGFCWDIQREPEYSDEDFVNGFYYEFSETWEGFEQSGIDFAISELKKVLNNQKSIRI